MQITRKSLITGKTHTLNISCKEEDYKEWQKDKTSIQNVMPYLPIEDMEFLVSGITSEERKTFEG